MVIEEVNTFGSHVVWLIAREVDVCGVKNTSWYLIKSGDKMMSTAYISYIIPAS